MWTVADAPAAVADAPIAAPVADALATAVVDTPAAVVADALATAVVHAVGVPTGAVPPASAAPALDVLAAVDPRIRLAVGAVAVVLGTVAVSVGAVGPAVAGVDAADRQRRGLRPSAPPGERPQPTARGRSLALLAGGALALAVGAVLFWSALAA